MTRLLLLASSLSLLAIALLAVAAPACPQAVVAYSSGYCAQSYVAPVQAYVAPVQAYAAPVYAAPVQAYVAPQTYSYSQPAQIVLPQRVEYVRPEVRLSLSQVQGHAYAAPQAVVVQKYVQPQAVVLQQKHYVQPQAFVVQKQVGHSQAIVVEKQALGFGARRQGAVQRVEAPAGSSVRSFELRGPFGGGISRTRIRN